MCEIPYDELGPAKVPELHSAKTGKGGHSNRRGRTERLRQP
jgi:hypothetical protein